MTKENDPRDYVGYDIHGYPFNKKYPPNKKKYGQSFEGYPYKALHHPQKLPPEHSPDTQ
ncbi:hypothetical protein [Bacteroides acidifaciens]|uniref:hypothetical protein n=1 Tax=Bacteroides acidifaciens TaxID=85831 RepID=UPI0025B41BB7|nr:hypothetical protein [Bacteroides acidifaciens]